MIDEGQIARKRSDWKKTARRRTTNNGGALYIDAETIHTVDRYIRLKRKKSANGDGQAVGKNGSFVDNNPNIIHPNKGTLALSNSVTPTSPTSFPLRVQILSPIWYKWDVGNGTG